MHILLQKTIQIISYPDYTAIPNNYISNCKSSLIISNWQTKQLNHILVYLYFRTSFQVWPVLITSIHILGLDVNTDIIISSIYFLQAYQYKLAISIGSVAISSVWST